MTSVEERYPAQPNVYETICGRGAGWSELESEQISSGQLIPRRSKISVKLISLKYTQCFRMIDCKHPEQQHVIFPLGCCHGHLVDRPILMMFRLLQTWDSRSGLVIIQRIT